VYSYSKATAMNAPLFPEVLRRLDATPQGDLPLATEGVLRYVWENRFGEMLIEVEDGVVYVNGDRIEPAMVEGGRPSTALVER
jgi:hypothetical protein